MPLKEIKTKPEGGKPKLLESAAKASKTAVKDLWLKSREKSISALKETPFAKQQEESSSAPANRAENQLLSDAEHVAGKSAPIVYRGGKKLAQRTAQTLQERKQETQAAEQIRHTSSLPGSPPSTVSSGSPAAPPSMRTARSGQVGVSAPGSATGSRSPVSSSMVRRTGKTGKQAVSSVPPPPKTRPVSAGRRTEKTARRAAGAAQSARKNARRSAQAARQAAKRTTQGIRAAARAGISTLRAALLAGKALIAALAAGGWVAVVVVLILCLLALVAGSCFGVFFGSEPVAGGVSVSQAVSQLDAEFQAEIDRISQSVDHNRLELTGSGGEPSVAWKEVLAVFAARETGAEDGAPVVVLHDGQVQALRTILWDMTSLSHTTRKENKTVQAEKTALDGSTIFVEETITETVLEIRVAHRPPAEMAEQYRFNSRQNDYLALLTSPDTDPLWAQLLDPQSAEAGTSSPP